MCVCMHVYELAVCGIHCPVCEGVMCACVCVCEGVICACVCVKVEYG